MKFYLVGIKGSGMSALAHLLLDDGYQVEGSDVDKYIFTENRLKQRKVKIHSLNNKDYLKNSFVIIGHDFIDDYLINDLNKKGIPFLEYHKFLSFYINKNNLISVCGSHGKTTLVGLLSQASNNCSFLRGDGYGKKTNKEDFFFLESCEYKDHFLEYSPSFICITNIDYDHVDYFKKERDYISSFNKFSNKSNKGLIDYDDSKKINNPYYFTYGINKNADFYADDYISDEHGIRGKIYFQNEFIIDFNYTNLYGIHLIKDIVCVVAFYYLHHYDIELVISKIKQFKMADRRFNIEKYNNVILIDDYAHHPKQIEMNYSNVKTIYANYIHIGIFKPDRKSRLEHFLLDIKCVLSKFDYAFVTNFNDKKHIDLIKKLVDKNIIYLDDPSKIINYLDKNKKYTFSLMSSKNLDEVKEIIKSHFK